MTTAPSLCADKQRRLNEVLAEYLEGVEAGRAPDRAELLAGHPDLAGELKEFFTNHDRVGGLVDASAGASVTRANTVTDTPGPAAMAAPPPDRLGDYEVRHEIARGGMGVVYRAHQISLDRDVALKMLLPGVASARALRRFHIEAEAAAHLDHPNIVPIYEVGEIDGQPYFTMKLVEGGSLAQHPPTAPAEVAGLMASVARAVHHAHQRGILHRDLKPANILLEADGRPMVTDFGLAKRAEQDPGLTQSQTVVGTPAYMPPEQAQGRNDQLTTAADVYSLGAVLYELLTGRPPFAGATYFDTLIKVVEEPPVPPRKHNPRVPADLEAVCLKCLEKDPAHRYSSALALAEDLERCRAGEAVSVRPPTRAERAWRWARRNRLAAALAAAVGGLMIAGTAGSLAAAWRIAAARDRAEENAREAALHASREAAARGEAEEARNQARTALAAAEKARAENQRLLISGYVANGGRASDGGDVFGALVWYGAALDLDRGEAAREEPHRVRLAAALRRCPRLVQVWFGHEAIAPALSPDGRRVLLFHKDVARTYDVAGGEAVSAPMKHGGNVERAAFSPDGKWVVTVAADGTARVWDAATGKPATAPLRHDKAVHWAAFSPDGTRLATAGADRTARVWDVAAGTRVAGPLTHDLPVLFAAFSRDGKRLVTSGGDAGVHKGEIRVWDLTAARPSSRVLYRGTVIHWAHLTADGEHVVAAGGWRTAHLWPLTTGKTESAGVGGVRLDPDGAAGPDPTRVVRLDGSTAHVYDLSQGKPVGPPLAHGGEMILAAFSPDGGLVVTAARDRTARVWEAATGKPLTPPLRHDRAVHRAAFSADGRRLLTTTEDGVVRVWDLASREWVQPVRSFGGGPAALSPDGLLVAAADKGGAVWVRDAVSGKVRHGPWKLAGPITDLVFAADGLRVLAAGDSGARVWDAVTGAAVTPVLPHTGAVHRLLFSPDGSRAVIVGAKDSLEVYDAGTGAAEVRLGVTVKVPVFGLALTPDGRGMVALRTRQNIDVHDMISGALLAGPFRHAGLVTAAAFSPDSKRLAVATTDGTAFLWDVASARPAAPPLAHGAPLRQVAFSGDGRRLVTVAEDHTARAWDVATGQPVTPLLPHAEPVVLACLSADGHRLCTRTRGGTAYVWDLSPDPRPVEDLVRLTQLLSGETLDVHSGGLERMPATGLREAWPALRAKYPQEFTLSSR
jgi:WD40 repeat protein